MEEDTGWYHLQSKMLPIKQVHKAIQILAMQQTTPCTKVFRVSNARAQTQLIPPVYLLKEKKQDGKAEGWDIQCCWFASRTTAEIARKQDCSHGLFASPLHSSNGNPTDPAPGEHGKPAIKSFPPICLTSLSCSNHCKQLTVNQFRITEKHEVWRRQINKVGYAS